MSKKLILFIAFLITSFVSIVNITPVNAEEYTGQAIWPSEFISNVYIKKVKPDGSGKYQQGRFMRRSEDNAFVYCLQPFADIDNNLPYYNIARSDYAVYLNMTEEQWDKISLIAYYGYGYGNHQEHKWYAITQVMIWRVADPTTDFYFTNTLNGTRNDSLFVSEIEEIQNLVNNHYRIPKFSSQKISIPLGQSITINDSNNILNEFTISKTSNVSASVNGNNLTITATGIGNGYIQLKKQDSIYTTPPIAYFSNHSQNVMRVGSFDPIVVDLKLEVMGGKVEIQKVDSKTLLNKAQGNATLKGAVYGVFKMDGTKIAELITDSNGYAKSDYLSSVGKLYIQELKASEGYKLDPNKHEIEISETNLEPSIQVKEEIIEGKIKISKYDSETNSCKAQGEASLIGAKYQVINSNGEVVDTLTIGEDCTAVSKNLPYGNYKIVETDSSKGYLIDNNSYNVFINSETTFNVTSKEDVIKGKIKISKYDSETNSCKAQGGATLKGAIYEIFDIRGNLVDTLTIGEDCTAVSKNLPYGNYKIKEKDPSKGYLLDVNIYSANVTENEIIDIVSKEDVIKNRISILKQYDDFTQLKLKDMSKTISDMTYKYINPDTQTPTIVPAGHYENILNQITEKYMEEVTSRQFLSVMYNQLSSLKKEDEKYFYQALLCIDMGINPKDLRINEQIALTYTNEYIGEKQQEEKKNFHLLSEDIVETYEQLKNDPEFQSKIIRESDRLERQEDQMFRNRNYDSRDER